MSSAVKLWERPSKQTKTHSVRKFQRWTEAKWCRVAYVKRHFWTKQQRKHSNLLHWPKWWETINFIMQTGHDRPRFKEQFIQSFCCTSAEELYREGISAKIAGCLRPLVSRERGEKGSATGFKFWIVFLAGFREDQNTGLFEHGSQPSNFGISWDTLFQTNPYWAECTVVLVTWT